MRKRYFEPTLPVRPVERHVMQVAGRLKEAAERENSRVMALQ